MDLGETNAEALRREMREEIGLVVETSEIARADLVGRVVRNTTAEGVGFEPTVGITPQRFSRAPHAVAAA